jgi:hypothetical protein
MFLFVDPMVGVKNRVDKSNSAAHWLQSKRIKQGGIVDTEVTVSPGFD